MRSSFFLLEPALICFSLSIARGIFKNFIIHELIHFVFPRETPIDSFFVFEDSAGEVISYAGIKDCVCLVRKYVHIVVLVQVSRPHADCFDPTTSGLAMTLSKALFFRL